MPTEKINLDKPNPESTYKKPTTFEFESIESNKNSDLIKSPLQKDIFLSSYKNTIKN